MDSRSTRYRSLDAKAAAPSAPRPRERHNSVPTSKNPAGQPRRQSGSSKGSDGHSRSSKGSYNEEPSKGPERRSTGSRQLDRHTASSFVLSTLEGDLADKVGGPKVLPTITLVVLGAARCGKSTFIRNAIGNDLHSSTPYPSIEITLKNRRCRVQFVELLWDDVDFSSDRRIQWPAYLNGSVFPDIDAACCLYDVAVRESVEDIPRALTCITNAGLPCILVASKSDTPQDRHEIPFKFHDSVRRNLPIVAVAEVTQKSPDTAKRCVLTVLERVRTDTRSSIQSKHSATASTPASGTSHQSSRDTSPKKSRSRSRSNSRLQISKSKELLLNISSRPAVIESADEESENSSNENGARSRNRARLRLDTKTTSQSQQRPTDPQTPVSSGEHTTRLFSSADGATTAVPETPDSYYVKSMLRPASTDTVDSRAYQTFLNMDDDPNEQTTTSEVDSISSTLVNVKVGDSAKVGDGVKQETGVPFRDLVDRLLSLPAGKSDSKFVPSFLCLYRAFATPHKLLRAIIEQFLKIEKSNMVHFSKVAEMLRYLQVLAQWTATYPGDFSGGAVRDIAVPFVQSIEKSKVFAPAAREISNNLDTIVTDGDADWSCNDASVTEKGKDGPTGHKKSTTSASIAPSGHSSKSSSATRTSRRDDTDSDDDGKCGSGVQSASSSMIKSFNSSSQSYTNLMQLESAKSQAERLKYIPQIKLSKFEWHKFMETPVDELAKEITRIDWTIYSAIRPRDYVRHVSLSTTQKKKCRAVDNISAMVKNFNHLALFVSGMILLRDKPKHRAKALEKFMALAWKVRQLNNYNSLGAIVAGITGHEIARLTATRDLVAPEPQKQFLRLTILMGISRSHAAYRMAWENSFTERIPFLPLVRQDLTMAASANPTFIGHNINWKKFEIMGDVIVGIQKSLEQPYSFSPRSHRSEDVVKLLLETKIVEESEDSADPRSELYDRSVQVEPQMGADPRKKFDWLRR